MSKLKLNCYYLIFICSFFAIESCSDSPSEKKDLAKLVNPFIGTGGHGHTYPGASAPFGFVQLSPDTRLEGWDGCSGYHFSDTIIYGFSHTHLSGTGVSDYGDVLLMPLSQVQFNNAYGINPDSGYGSRFNHKNEFAEAGFYKVHLDDVNVDVKLTSTDRCGFHEYTFNDSSKPNYILIDLQHRDKLKSFKINPINDSVVVGKRISSAWASEQHIYYYLKFSDDYTNLTYNEDSSKAIFQFSTEKVSVKIGLSAVGIEGAKENLLKEIPDWNFEQAKNETQEKWNNELAKIEVKMQHDSDLVIFYTALYHSFLNPNTFQDVNNNYRGTDLETHNTNNEFNNYTIFSLWDTYRATHPLFTIVEQEKTLDFINTFLHQHKNGGKLPVWELAGNYTGCMIGYHSVSVIADAYLKGIKNFDTELALEAMMASANEDELGKSFYIKNGYIGASDEHESVSKVLEYAYDDYCIAQFAKALGKDSIYNIFIQRAQFYKNIFDPETGFMRTKNNQQFKYPFNPFEVDFNYTEANAWQYSFYVPQDINGLIELHGSDHLFEAKLDELFSVKPKTVGRTQVDITGLVGQYAHGNEPSHHMAYLYNYIGKAHKTQSRVRSLLSEMYSNKPNGLIGNEDCGQMSSWYILSSLGFYPVTPGNTNYAIGSPHIKEATINLENGKKFNVSVENQSSKNVYVKKLVLNGSEYKEAYLNHKDIINGGELKFIMSDKPNTNWFKVDTSSNILENLITPVPYITDSSQVFSDSIDIKLANPNNNNNIYYSINGKDFKRYEKAIRFKESFKIYIKAVDPRSNIESKVVEARFFKLNNDRKVVYKHPYNTQYTAGGKKGLVDLIRGGKDFRTGRWQGFQYHDLEITVELDSTEVISYISSGYIQDIKSWIWMPQEVSYSYSTDGENFSPITTISNKIPIDKYGSIITDFSQKINPVKARYIRLKAKQLGKIPEWHLGKGDESFIFIDEIIIQ